LRKRLDDAPQRDTGYACATGGQRGASPAKTPANSLHAAMQREIRTKGPASRFVKAERGKFALAEKT